MTIEGVFSGLASGAIAAWGVFKLWIKGVQDTQEKHTTQIEHMLSVRLPEHSGKIAVLERDIRNSQVTLDRIADSQDAIHARITTIAEGLARVGAK
jgi:hypothetical protein